MTVGAVGTATLYRRDVQSVFIIMPARQLPNRFAISVDKHDIDQSAHIASVTIKQDGVNSFATALWNPQHYEIFVDDRMAGLLNGYQNRWTCSVTPGRHSVYVRAYARDSNSLTRVYGYSDTLQLELLPDEDKTLSCGLLRRPPMRKILVLTSACLTVLLYAVLGLSTSLSPRTRHLPVMIMALITIACSWYGYSSRPGSSIYLQERPPI